jgi:chloramphenicol O-acetyltransferase
MEVRWKTIDLETWERRDTFFGFKDFDFPYSIVGAEIDITQLRAMLRERTDFSLFLSLVYAVCRAANQVPAFKQRIRGQQVIEHEIVHADYTVPKGEESFGIRVVEYSNSFAEFHRRANSDHLSSWVEPGNSTSENDHLIFMSCMPWIQFNHVVQPIDRKSGSIPRIAWGKFHTENSRTLMPISIQTHHSLVDGIHVARFLDALQTFIDSKFIFE